MDTHTEFDKTKMSRDRAKPWFHETYDFNFISFVWKFQVQSEPLTFFGDIFLIEI